MVDFGFKISKDRQIDYDNNDFSLVNKILLIEPSIKTCISCGTCAATCSSAQFTNFSLRKIILLVKRGEICSVESEIKKCMLCGKCQIACPRNVNTRNLILQIRKELAVKTYLTL